MKLLPTAISRFLLALRRPSKSTNVRLMKERGESEKSFTIREAREEDFDELVNLHVVTWNDTYPGVKNKSTHQLRAHQWRRNFQLKENQWFCYVVQNGNGRLVGFATGNTYADGKLPFEGQVRKIYVLRDYQRLGLGRKLICRVAQRFRDMGINSMLLFSEATNPSIRFYEAMGGERLYAENGEFHGAYGWKDISKLAAG